MQQKDTLNSQGTKDLLKIEIFFLKGESECLSLSDKQRQRSVSDRNIGVPNCFKNKVRSLKMFYAL